MKLITVHVKNNIDDFYFQYDDHSIPEVQTASSRSWIYFPKLNRYCQYVNIYHKKIRDFKLIISSTKPLVAWPAFEDQESTVDILDKALLPKVFVKCYSGKYIND